MSPTGPGCKSSWVTTRPARARSAGCSTAGSAARNWNPARWAEMSYPFLAHAQVLEPGTLQELDTLVTRLRTFLQVAHRDDGSLYPPAASVPGVLAILTADPSSPA